MIANRAGTSPPLVLSPFPEHSCDLRWAMRLATTAMSWKGQLFSPLTLVLVLAWVHLSLGALGKGDALLASMLHRLCFDAFCTTHWQPT